MRIASKVILPLLALGALTGCADIKTTKGENGILELSATYSPAWWQNGAENELKNHAWDACPAGYTKLGEHIEKKGDGAVLTWRIRCG